MTLYQMDSGVYDSNVLLFGGRKRDGGRETATSQNINHKLFKRKERLTRKKKVSQFGKRYGFKGWQADFGSVSRFGSPSSFKS